MECMCTQKLLLQPTCSLCSVIRSSWSDPSSYCNLAAATVELLLAAAAFSAIIIPSCSYCIPPAPALVLSKAAAVIQAAISA